MASARDFVDLMRRVEDLGFPVSQSRSGHWRVDTPNGPVFLPRTPSDWRGVRNAVSLLRRKGVPL